MEPDTYSLKFLVAGSWSEDDPLTAASEEDPSRWCLSTRSLQQKHTRSPKGCMHVVSKLPAGHQKPLVHYSDLVQSSMTYFSLKTKRMVYIPCFDREEAAPRGRGLIGEHEGCNQKNGNQCLRRILGMTKALHSALVANHQY